jgi:hypothetical protein
MSKRDLIKLSPDEQLAFLDAERVVNVASNGPRGWPHLMPLWYLLRDAEGEPVKDAPAKEIWVWTFTKSQKVINLKRDERATAMVESGTEYHELKGVQYECRAHLIDDLEAKAQFGLELANRYAGGIESIGPEAVKMFEAQAAKRTVIRFEITRAASWDHSKLGGGY